MKVVKILAGVLGAVVLVFVGAMLVMPRDFRVERTTVMSVPVEAAWLQAHDLKRFTTWSPWDQMDPTNEVSFGETSEGVGASYSWKGEQTGAGSLTIVGEDGMSRIDQKLDFGEMGVADGWFTFEEVDGGTKVAWGFSGDAVGFAGPMFAAMMDGMIGAQFEEGLESMEAKARVEAERLAAEAEAAAKAKAEAEAMAAAEAVDAGEAAEVDVEAAAAE